MGKRYKLIEVILENSTASSWEEAVEEWYIIDYEEDEYLESSCVCGKEELRYLYKIENGYNGNILFPIGSSCIRKFGRSDLDNEVKSIEKMFKLLNALKDGKFVSLSSELFSRKLLTYLYKDFAFDTRYNGFNGENDYNFMLKMFNMRDENITYNQRRKISAIILNSIFPYLRETLKEKDNVLQQGK